MLPKEAVEQFKEIYREYYGEEESDKDKLYEMAENLISIYKVVYQTPSRGFCPINRDKYG